MTSTAEELQGRARQRISDGALPCHPGARMWGSCGSGAACSLCDQPIRPEEVEYEVATPDRAAESGERVLRFHLECHAIWEAECGKEHS